MHRVRMLLHFGVIPYIVFDGDYLPSKAKTEVERAKRREESKQNGLELYRLNKPSQAHLELQKAVDVSPEMARQLIDELKKIGVQYVVAPYEADAQLVYMEKKGIIQGMLSEDSDLLVFGAKCLLTKLDQYGECIEVNRADFTACKEISLVGWTDAEFRRMAILSGCDYLANINRMGLKSAYRYVRKYKTIEKIVRMLQFDGQYHVPTGYIEAFYKAELTFLHQRVFCPLVNDVVMMTELEDGMELQDLSFAGGEVEQKLAIGVAKGDLDPMTKAPIRVQDAPTTSTPKTSWTKSRMSMGENFSSMKENKSIETFFRSRREPLAELDPNSFTPSPTQQVLLRQANRTSWDSSPALAVTPSLRTSTSAPSHASRPALSNRGVIISATLSEFGTSKKRRLVNDKEVFQSPADVEGTRSSFFTAKTPDVTPSNRGRTKKGKKASDFNIWSDDSVEDAMVELASNPIADKLPREQKIKVLVDEVALKSNPSMEEPHWEAPTQEDSQASRSSRGNVQTESSMSIAASSFTSSADSIAQTTDRHPREELAELTQKFSYRTESASQSAILEEMRSQKSDGSSQNTPKPSLPRQKSMSALQRLGVGALSRSKSTTELLGNHVGRDYSFETLLRTSSNKETQKAAQPSPSLPLAHTFGPDATASKGSEDTIIPDSEDEGSDVISEVGEEVAKPSINLGRFAFTG